ncbi:hypothetical protein GRI38_11385 [Altererythrobacter aurantiacus]|uniref:Uncharacterized protein n=1 Tax=Parapontixanthobacter aurantiacus TaxID=1463599 RepID=A0A844ZI60_9SPHN|nr:hypothetical protein [Parapontixanthobacter aurantiacus]MXO86627.1 hypothetical protein [Parapontixanthobacter aurantiacus]
MSDESDKYNILVDKLLNKTEEGSLDWGIVRDEQPQTKLGDYIIRLRADETAEGEPVEVVLLYRNNNELIDQFNDNDLRGSYWAKMTKLRELALRKARGVDKILDEILKNL